MAISEGATATVESASGKRRGDLVAAAFVIAAVAFGLVSLTYPFGRDQGLYFYVAREWVKHGSIPYRDILDHKTPGIYFIHALSILVFGETMWGIRVLELGAVLACGAAAAAIASPPEERLRRPILAGGAFAMSLLYFGSFDFWDTAQSEIWYTLFGFLAVAFARRAPSLPRAALAAGAFAGAAVIMKPPAIWFAFAAAGVLIQRIAKAGEANIPTLALHAARFAGAAAIVPVLSLGYFAAHGALGALVDVVVGANGYYVKHEKGADNIIDAIVGGVRHFAPLSVLLPLGAVFAILYGRREQNKEMVARSSLGLLLLAAGFMATAMQGKFYLLHQGSMIGPLCVLAIVFALNLENIVKGALGTIAPAVLLFCMFCVSAWTGGGLLMWKAAVHTALDYRAGRISREDYIKTFRRPNVAFWYDQSVHVADWLAAHTTPEDSVTVRGFEPQIYALANRRHVGRFFWTTFIVNPDRAYRREEWLAEDLRDVTEHPPKYIVSIDWAQSSVDSKAWAEQLGYERVELIGDAAIMAKKEVWPSLD